MRTSPHLETLSVLEEESPLVGAKLESSADKGPRVELDTVGMSFRVAPFGMRIGKPYRLPCGAHIVWHGTYGRVEGSVAVAVSGTNVRALPLVDAVEVLRWFLEEAIDFCGVNRSELPKFEDTPVCRLDLVRDFHSVTSPAAMLVALSRLPQKGRVTTKVWNNRMTGQPQSLRIGNISGSAKLYDKCLESNGVAEPGHLRFEAEMRSALLTSVWARRNGGVVRTVEHLSEVGLGQLRRAMFRRVGFDREVANVRVFADAVASSGLSYQDMKGILGRVWLPQFTSGPTRKRYDDLMKAHNIPSITDDPSVERPWSLSYDAGTEVVREPARVAASPDQSGSRQR